MNIEQVITKKAPQAAGPYSQAVRSGNFLFVSGQLPVNPEDGNIASTVENQAKQAMTNLKNIIEDAGFKLSDVVKTTLFIRNMDDFPTVNAVYAGFFSEPFPARSCVEVSRLPKGSLLEIDAIALH